jgi:2-phosphoglycolate phosphatase
MSAATTHVLFDLDGTLIDSKPAILAGYRHAVRTVTGIEDFPGPGVDVPELLKKRLPEAFADLGFPELADQGAVAYDEYYREHGTLLVTVYPGIAELLDGLDAAGIAYGIVTNKGRGRSLSDLRHVGIDPDRMSVLITAEDSVERKPHPKPILIGLERAGADPGGTVYVGDGPHDVAAARAAGLRAAAVSWGYYDHPTLQAATPHVIADRAEDLLAHLTNGTATR